MLGYKTKLFKTHSSVSLEDLVPPDNFYRHLEAKLDLRFVREWVTNQYAALGRPSIDPVTFFKLQLIMFFEDIRSERQLMETVNLNLAHRWYIGYDLDEPVPDHSSLTRIRDRYGLDVFQQFFEKIVELCIQAGLVWGKELYFDGTKVQANAALTKMVPRFYYEARQHLQRMFDQAKESAPNQNPTPAPPRGFVHKYDGTRFPSRPSRHWYKRKADVWISLSDPDATPLRPDVERRAKLGYHDHYVVDGGKARIILAALITPASVMDNTPMLDLARWIRFRWRLVPCIAVGDAKYGTVANIVGLEQDGIRAYIPTSDFSQRTKFYPAELFRYHADQDCYRCPQGQTLRFSRRKKTEGTLVYQADAEVCHACPVKVKCTNSSKGRQIHRSVFKEYLDRAESYRETEAYKKALRKRQVWVEPLFGEAKQYHGLERSRLRGLQKVNIQGLMIAAGQNLKRLLPTKAGESGKARLDGVRPSSWHPASFVPDPFGHHLTSHTPDFFNRLTSCRNMPQNSSL